MKRNIFLTAFVACSLAANAQVVLNIDTDTQQGVNVSPTHYGIFFEDINHAADGGLYAELIRNRSFEEDGPHSDPRHKGWKPGQGITAWQTTKGASLTLTSDNLLNSNQKHAALLTVDKTGAGISNSGFWGINAVNGQQYKLTLWVRSVSGKNDKLTASLVGVDGTTLGSVDIPYKASGKWQKLTANLIATGNDAEAHFLLTANKPCQLELDVISLFPPTFKGRENGCRPQLAQMLADMKPKFMRFPGGCYVEGQVAPENAFRWQRTVGPIEERPGHYDANWQYWTTDGLGFHEFLQFSEDIGAKPLYVVNVGIWHGGFTPVDSLDMWVKECMDALEYANGDVTTPMGKLRAQNGHPAPFNIEYLEIGNENANFNFHNNSDQSERYHERYRIFYNAIKAKYPNMNCIGNVEAWGTDAPSWRSNEPVELLDEHYYRNPSWFADAFNKYDSYDRQGPKIYVGEYAVTSQYGKVGNLNAALGEAVYMLGMERNSDVVAMNSYAPIFVNENASNWPTDMIHFNSGQAFGTPSYWVQQMFPTHVGNKVINSTMTWQLPEYKKETLEKPVSVGITSWNTCATYEKPVLIVDGVEQTLPNIAQWQKELQTPQGRDGKHYVRAMRRFNTDVDAATVTTLPRGEGIKWMCPVTFTAKEYIYKVRAKKNEGAEGFMVVFNQLTDNDFDWLNIGGWGNTMNQIEQTMDGGRSTITKGKRFVVENDKWYDLEVRVKGDSITAFIDGEEQFTTVHRSSSMRGVFQSTTYDELSNKLYVKVVNVGPEQTEATINLAQKAFGAELLRLSSENGQDENTMEHPLNIMPRPARIDLSSTGKRLDFHLAPFSVNIVTVQL